MNKSLFDTIKDITATYDIDPYFAYTVAILESNGNGYLGNGFPIIRFEKHVFKRHLNKTKATPHALRKAECLIGTGWNTYQDALKIEERCAKLATSFGMFQIMGFNFSLVGYDSVESFVDAVEASVENQIEAFCKYVISTGCMTAIRNKDFAKFAYKYNGPNYQMNKYDEKLKRLYDSIVPSDKPKKQKGYSQTKE
jgi:hypothetical protein